MKLVLGGSGQLGTAFRKLDPSFSCPTREELDIGDLSLLESALERCGPELIINCAAFADVDGAEAAPSVAMDVNARAVLVMSEFAATSRIPFVTFSTDHVFDGRASQPYVESAVPSPVNVYGRTKLAGERAALSFEGSLVVRTSWLFSATHDSFVSRVLGEAVERPIRVVDDQFGNPTPVDDLAVAVLRLLDARTTGLVHLTGQPWASRYEFARAAVASAGLDPDVVTACSTADYPTPAIRPKWAALHSERVVGELRRMRPWKAALSEIAPTVLDRLVAQ